MTASNATKIEGLDELRAKLRELSDKDRKLTRRAVFKGGGKILKVAKAKAGTRSKRLPKGIAMQVTVTKNNVVARIGAKRGAKVRFAHLLEKGTKAHTIKAKHRREMNMGHTNFGSKVHHPGSRARPWLGPAFEETRDDALNAIRDEMKAQIAKLTI